MVDTDKQTDNETSAAGILKNFYDEFGWQLDETSGLLNNHAYFQDMEEVATKYRYDHELKFRPVYGEGGKFFLDAGCGGEPRPVLSKNFSVHLCLDISVVGLKAARDQLGGSGAYVLSDLAQLPFKDGAFDGVLASHCLYHVDKDKQKDVLRELYRVTGTNKFILVFYSSRYNLISWLHKVPDIGFGWANLVLNRLGFHLGNFPPYFSRRSKKTESSESSDGTEIPDLYSYPHNPVRLVREFESADVSCLMTFTNYDTRLLRKLRLLKVAIRVFDFLEKTFPHLMRYVGKFACIRIQKHGESR